MNITKEKLEVVFKVEKKVPKEVLKKFNLELLNGSLVRGKVSKEEQILEFINEMSPYITEKNDAGIMVLKTYCIKTYDEFEASVFLNSLFSPKFQMKEYVLSNITFYLDMNDATYSINMDYNFEDKIIIKIGIFIDKNDDYHRIFKDFKDILANILGEENKNVCSK